MNDCFEATFPDGNPALTDAELAERSGLTITEVHVLVECGALSGERGGFTIEGLTVARRARRLREELALDDAHALAVVLRMRQRIRALEVEVEAMRARFWI